MNLNGRNGNKLEVDKDGRGFSYSSGISEFQYYAEKGKAYAIFSEFTTTGANQEFLHLACNSSTELFVVSKIVLGTSVNNAFDVFKVTAGTAASTGTCDVTNYKFNSTATPEITTLGKAEVTGSVSGPTLVNCNVLANGVGVYEDVAAILGNGDELAIGAGAAGDVKATVIGYFKPIELV